MRPHKPGPSASLIKANIIILLDRFMYNLYKIYYCFDLVNYYIMRQLPFISKISLIDDFAYFSYLIRNHLINNATLTKIEMHTFFFAIA